MTETLHRKINNGLACVVILVSSYALLLPFLPSLQLWIQQRNPANHIRIADQLDTNSVSSNTADNRLLIPEILVDEPIVTGENLSIIDDGGIWLRPQASQPTEQGNIVLAGHRFTYAQPFGPLYHLDKLSIGDEIGMRWEGETYVFVVEEIQTVTADSTGIEAPTDDRRLTLYTCTPVLTAENRLVITAREQS